MAMYMGDIYTVPANITGLPALSLPCGLTETGLPIGLSLMGARDSLAHLLSIGAAYESRYEVNKGLRPYDAVKGGNGK